MAAVRFRAASHHSQTAAGRLPQLTPAFAINVRLGQGQRCNVAGVDFGDTTVFAMHLSVGESVVTGKDELKDSMALVFIVDGYINLLDKGSGRAGAAERGDIWAFGRNTCIELSVTEDVQLMAVTLPMQVLEEFGLQGSSGLQVLDPNSTLVSPALGFLREIAVQEMEVPSVAAYFMEKLVHEMVGGIMLENRGARVAAATRKSFYEQAMDFIAAAAGDSSLTPASLADELSLSLRQLQREFQRNNTSIAAVILQHRIDLAVRLLKDPKLDILPLEQIAEHSGFSSAVQLRRVLREAHLGSPRDIRSHSLQERGSNISRSK